MAPSFSVCSPPPLPCFVPTASLSASCRGVCPCWYRFLVSRFEAVQSLVRSVRNAKAEYKVEPGKKIPAVIQVGRQAGRRAGAVVVAVLRNVKWPTTTLLDCLAGGWRARHTRRKRRRAQASGEKQACLEKPSDRVLSRCVLLHAGTPRGVFWSCPCHGRLCSRACHASENSRGRLRLRLSFPAVVCCLRRPRTWHRCPAKAASPNVIATGAAGAAGLIQT